MLGELSYLVLCVSKETILLKRKKKFQACILLWLCFNYIRKPDTHVQAAPQHSFHVCVLIAFFPPSSSAPDAGPT